VHSRAAQLEKLENKIEYLVNALSSQPGHSLLPLGQPSPPLSQGRSTDGSLSARRYEVLETLCADMEAESPEDSQASNDETLTSGPGTFNGSNISSMMAPVDQEYVRSIGVTIEEAEVLFDRYKRLMAHALPFCAFPPGVTALELWNKKRLLLHAIVTVAYFHDLAKQQALVRGLMRDISERVLLNNEKNVGIIQAILVFVGWYHPHVFWGQQVTNLLHIAIAMTIDLGIDRSPNQCQTDFKTATARAVHGSALITKAFSAEEYRALTGVFYLTSMLSSSFKKIDALSYTKFMDDAVKTLEENREYESDLFLVQIVRVQHLAEDLHTTETPSAPMQMYVKAFDADLTRLKQNDPNPNPENNVLLQLQYLTAEILVWELSLIDLQENKTNPLRSHLDDIYHCLDAIKRFIDIFFSISPNEYLLLPFSFFGQFAHAFIVLTKIASLELDGWDVKNMHQFLNFMDVIGRAADNFEAAGKSSPDGLKVNNDVFSKWGHRVRWMKSVYEAKYNPPQSSSATPASDLLCRRDMQEAMQCLEQRGAGLPVPQNLQPQQPTPPIDLQATPQSSDVLSADFFNYLDNDFWNSFPAGYDLGFNDINPNIISPAYNGS
jgi:hypothetical protein